MLTMLLISGCIEDTFPCDIVVDPYVPLIFKAYDGVLAGAKYYRIGNFDTSLLEIGLEPDTLLIRRIGLVSIGRVDCSVGVRMSSVTSEQIGLPIVDSASLSSDRTDEQIDFAVSLIDRSLIVDWSQNAEIESVIRHQRVEFCLVGHVLCRLVFRDLCESECKLLSEHINAAT